MSYKSKTDRTSKNYTPAHLVKSVFGVPRKVTGITVHHWGIDNQNFYGVEKFLCENDKPTSAHYVVQDGIVSCIVDPDDASWHAGNAIGNATTIGIEMRPEMTDGDFKTLVELCADLESTYGDMLYYQHYQWQATQCPGRYSPRIGELIRAVNAELARRKGTPVRPPKPTATKPKPAPAAVHYVKPGDSLSAIAVRYGTSIAALLKLNTYIKNPNYLAPGDRVRVR